jgi:hypothetical protein
MVVGITHGKNRQGTGGLTSQEGGAMQDISR